MNIEEYQNTLNSLKQQKNLLINNLNEKELENLQTIIENIIYIDKKINEYELIISNKPINNIFKNTNINLASYNYEALPYSNEIKKETQLSNIINKSKYIKESLKEVKLTIDILKIIKDKNGKCNIKIYDEVNNINIIYTYQNKSIVFYYYHCNKRPLCKGRGKFNENNNTFHIIKYCNNIEKHKELSYREFIDKIKNDKINDINFNKIKNQRNLITYIFDNY